MLRILICVLISIFPLLVKAQKKNTTSSANYFTVDERKIIETKWRYTYALHLESNTIIHRAENTYEYFLYFRYNNTFQQYLNGKFTRGNWQLQEDEISYSFKKIPKFTIATVNKKILVLEFTQSNSKGTYQYHFVRVPTAKAPFVKPANELPDVNVEALKPEKKEKKWWVFNKSKKKKRKKKRKKEKNATNLEPYISIEIIGGGFYGGINPTLRDYIHIKNDGRLIKEYKSVQNGLVVTKRDISRAELEKFAEYIVSQDFFDMERIYDCETEMCQRRKNKKPAPIPLRIAVAYKDKRKVVTISIFGKDAQKVQYVSYPAALDKIIAGIQKFSYRLDPS
jgi:hypothetical protein